MSTVDVASLIAGSVAAILATFSRRLRVVIRESLGHPTRSAVLEITDHQVNVRVGPEESRAAVAR